MKLLNMAVPKDSISMILDSVGDVENYNTTIFLHKSKIELAEEDNEFSKHIVLDLDKKNKNEPLHHQDYDGKRVYIQLTDKNKYSIS